MCGVPYHAVEGYLTRLLRKGYRIAICDQMEDPKLTKKIVRREVTRVLSPGTALDNALGQEQNNFLAALFEDRPQERIPSTSRAHEDFAPLAAPMGSRTTKNDVLSPASGSAGSGAHGCAIYAVAARRFNRRISHGGVSGR